MSFRAPLPDTENDTPPMAELTGRMSRFRDILRERKLDAALIVDPRNVRYLSGFTGEDSAALVTRHTQFLLTDFRFVDEASRSAKGWKVVLKPQGLMEQCGMIARKRKVRVLGIEPGAMRLADMPPLRKACERGVKLKQSHGMVGELRLVKSEWEVRRIEEALRIQEACFGVVGKELKDGISEREAASRLRYLMVAAGAEDQAFDTLFQFGANSSYPHGRPTARTLDANQVVLCDWGARKGGYHSDLTRTFFLGRIEPKLREIHRVVREAQQSVIAKIAPGVELAEIDKAAHRVIDKAGYKDNFGHSTGHGIGLSLHEHPSLSAKTKGKLGEGMVISIEPGVYVPGTAGIRVEDVVLVTRTGCRVLSSLPAGLRWDGSDE